MEHVVITGGAGFIGSHLCEQYLKRNYFVTAIDNFVTGSSQNIHIFKSNKNFKFIEWDISKGLPALDQVNLLLHFACPASPVDFEKIPIEILQVDSVGTFYCLELARKQNARFVFASTSEIYGDPLVHPQPESYWGNVNPIGKRSCYDEAKRFSEALTIAYQQKYEVNTGIVRIFNTYGPKMRLNDGRVVPNFCAQALQNQPLTVYGTGKQTRSFCYIDDLVDGIITFAASEIHEPINLGNPEEYSILDFAKKILNAVSNSKSTIAFHPLLHEDDPKQRCPDITKAKKLLGWTPKVNLIHGLEKTIDYFKTQIRPLA